LNERPLIKRPGITVLAADGSPKSKASLINVGDLDPANRYSRRVFQAVQISSNPLVLQWSVYRVWVAIFVGLSAFYAAIFTLTETLVLPKDIALWSVCNALPHVAFAIPLVDRLAPQLAERRAFAALAIGGISVSAYALTAYCSTIFLLAVTGGARTEGIFVRFFSGPALPWQMFQGTAYGCVAIAVGLWLDARRTLLKYEKDQSAARGKPQRWLVKTADGIIPIDPSDIIRIESAGEYSRLVLPGQSMLSRIGMKECEERLASYPFLRAHRSHIVHSDAIVRAESAGNGRLQLTLRNGDQIITSREGARLVRDRAT
jgi:two-component system, LytTR family, response regulator